MLGPAYMAGKTPNLVLIVAAELNQIRGRRESRQLLPPLPQRAQEHPTPFPLSVCALPLVGITGIFLLAAGLSGCKAMNISN